MSTVEHCLFLLDKRFLPFETESRRFEFSAEEEMLSNLYLRSVFFSLYADWAVQEGKKVEIRRSRLAPVVMKEGKTLNTLNRFPSTSLPFKTVGDSDFRKVIK